jgi:asparaginyl-tRNA synthetase
MRKGWIKSIRKSKGLKFIPITDGSKDHQITYKEGLTEVIGELKVGASIIVEGFESKTPRGFDEYVAEKITVVGVSDDDYPLQPKKHTDEFFRSIPHLRGRARQFQEIFKARHYLTQAIHYYMESVGFFQYYTPIITTADCEGAGETFKVTSDWLDEQLTVSGQLHGEVGMMALGHIYIFGPTFRAEKSATRKHLSEFWMVEPEMAWYDLAETVDFTEDFIKVIIGQTMVRMKKDGVDVSHLEELRDPLKRWAIKTYDEVQEEFGFEWGLDVSSEVEKKVTDKYGPTFITHYPKDIKPFYMKKDDRHALCFDLIFPGVGEIVGGSQREEDYQTLKDAMVDLDEEKMQWYLDTRKWGSVPHSGFGLGFERLLMFITKAVKIHDVIPFPVSY